MRIGLIRHFPVDCAQTLLMNSDEFQEWVKRYDVSPIKIREATIVPGIWDNCFCSDLPRAIETARYIYNGEIIQTELLREVPIAPVIRTKVKLPHLFWLIAARAAWLAAHPSQPEIMSQTKCRVRQCIADLPANESTLLITHGFLMRYIQQELFDRGYLGKRIVRAVHGELYIYEK